MLPRKIVQFSDGCTSQYKLRDPFLDISCYSEVIGDIKVARHFFESGHGKGPAYGCSGVVKSAITRSILAGSILSCAEDVFSYVSTNLLKDDEAFKRTFIFIDKKDVHRERPPKSKAQTVIGTMQLHCVKAFSPGIIKTRKVSCMFGHRKRNLQK